MEGRREVVALRLDGPKSSILKACFSPDGKYVVTASQGRMVHLWGHSMVHRLRCAPSTALWRHT